MNSTVIAAAQRYRELQEKIFPAVLCLSAPLWLKNSKIYFSPRFFFGLFLLSIFLLSPLTVLAASPFRATVYATPESDHSAV
ncbi:TPA: hypothetical protein DDW35_00445, partial [Candidatus Sumerlaeota bacterium]|nr:hypothetical protein [Candidatus Sumerlaeota bacterium]